MAAQRRKNNIPKTTSRSRARRATGGLGMKSYVLIVGTVVLAVAAVSALVIFEQGRRSSPSMAQMETVSLDKSMGAADAPVVVVEYGDFQ